jgi:multidrug efflux pump subunit AcrA (membrane-fusion protein)
MTVSIQLYQSEGSGIVVPLAAIASRDSQPIVWRIQSDTGRVEAVAIELVQYRNDSAVVHGSLQSGDRIVSAGVQRIDEKSTVRVWESKQSKAIHHE